MYRSIVACATALLVMLSASCGGGGGGTGNNDTGTASNPYDIGTASVEQTLSGSIAASETKYHKFTTGPATGLYTITLTSTVSDMSWSLFDNANFDPPAMLTCDNFMQSGGVAEVCTITLTQDTTYYLQVDEWDGNAEIYVLKVAPPVEFPPLAPTGVAAAAGSAKVNLTWNGVPNTVTYNVYWSTTAGAGKNGTKISGISSFTPLYEHVVATTGIPYYYVVTAQNAYGEGPASTQATATPTAALAPPQSFNFDDGTLQGWTTNNSWGTSGSNSHSGAYSAADSPAGYYSSTSNSWLLSPTFDLTGTTAPELTFWHRYATELDYDYGVVEISTDGGVTYTNITPQSLAGKKYTGTLSVFTLVTIDLTPYKASNRAVVRFRFYTDFDVINDGWYIDDIAISQ